MKYYICSATAAIHTGHIAELGHSVLGRATLQPLEVPRVPHVVAEHAQAPRVLVRARVGAVVVADKLGELGAQLLADAGPFAGLLVAAVTLRSAAESRVGHGGRYMHMYRQLTPRCFIKACRNYSPASLTQSMKVQHI